MQWICVYAGSQLGTQPEYAAAARALGKAIARRGLGLVYGGASIGLMGTIADAALTSGGAVIGVVPRNHFPDETPHPRLTELHEVDSMHERKAHMTELASAFIALPGGFGTLDELFEAVTWAQLGIHTKPVGLLNVLGFYDPLLAMLNHARSGGFIKPEDISLLACEVDPCRLLDRLTASRT